MRLLSVQAILEIEQGKSEVKTLQNFNDQKLKQTKYAILSHCWGDEDDEVLFKEMVGLTKVTENRDEVRQRFGYQKIVKTCEQARRDGFEWAWVDTCCIDKDSSAELSEAINSMYRWYENAAACYAYLHDVDGTELRPTTNRTFGAAPSWPKWFSRGWTLQELIAPREVCFFNGQWQWIGNKTQLASKLSIITHHVLGFQAHNHKR